MSNLETRISRRLKIGAAAILAAGLLAGSVAPSAAATWPHDIGASGWPHHHSSFNRHFWRGSQLSQAPAPSAEMMAFADESEAMQESTSYCASRFRSYDPSTGTYLGYDGYEHACP